MAWHRGIQNSGAFRPSPRPTFYISRSVGGGEDRPGLVRPDRAIGLMLTGGWYSPEGKEIQRYRDAVDSAMGGELEKALAVATKAGLVVGGEIMKTRPRGIPEDHPQRELLRHRTLSVSREYGTPAWVSSRGALTRIRK